MPRYLLPNHSDQLDPPEIEIIVDGARGIPSERVKWMAQNQQRLAKERFGVEYDELRMRHGAVQVLWGADGRRVAWIDLPTDRQREWVSLERCRFGGVFRDILSDKVPLGITGLRRLADALYASSVAQWERYHSDAEYAHSLICEDARSSPEIIPDSSGYAPTAVDLLSRPAYVARRFRERAMILQAHVGNWALIGELFADVEAMDEVHGMLGESATRKGLMTLVKEILDAELSTSFMKFARAVAMEANLRDYIVRVNAHPTYVLKVVGSAEAAGLLRGSTLKGALLRILDDGMQPLAISFRVLSFAASMARASEEEKSSLSPALYDAWADVETAFNIFAALGPIGDDWRNAPRDERYSGSFRAALQVGPIFRDALIERHITSVESLKINVVFDKIWAEVDKVSLARARKPFEKVVVFREVTPYWKPSVLPAVPAPTTAEDVAGESAASSPPQQRYEIYSLIDVHGYDPVRPESPEILQPFKEDAELRETTSPPRKGPKVKTRGTPSVEVFPAAVVVAGPPTEDSPVWFYVSRRIYKTFEHLLKPINTPMDWADFEKALTIGCGFSKLQREGSRVMFVPQDESNIPFLVHRWHSSEMPSHLVRNLGKRLKAQYGWTLARFSCDREPLTTSA